MWGGGGRREVAKMGNVTYFRGFLTKTKGKFSKFSRAPRAIRVLTQIYGARIPFSLLHPVLRLGFGCNLVTYGKIRRHSSESTTRMCDSTRKLPIYRTFIE